jgi:hypothetical protein
MKSRYTAFFCNECITRLRNEYQNLGWKKGKIADEEYNMRHTTKLFIVMLVCLDLYVMPCQLQSQELKPNKPKDISKFSSVSLQPGKIGAWKFYPSKGYHISTEQHPGLLTIRNIGGAEEDLKGTIGQPLPLSDYPPQWEFEVNMIRSQASKRGFMSPDDRGGCDAIGLNVALTFSEPSTWPKDNTQKPKKTYSFQLYSVHLLSPEMGSHEGKFMVWGDGELGRLGKVTGGDGVAFPKDKIMGDWCIPTYDVGDGQQAEGPSSTDTYFCFRLLSSTRVLFGVRFSQTHPWFTRELDVSDLGEITGVWEIGPIISGSSWIPTHWPGFKRPLDRVETYIGFCDFRYCCALPEGISIEHFSKDFDVPGNMGGGYQTEFYGLLTETWSHPGYLTWTLRGGYNATGVETVVDYGSQVIALSDKARKRDREDSHYRIYFKQPWEVELCFIAPDDSIPWNLFMDWYVFDSNDKQVVSWLPGIANIPGQGHSVGSLISESYQSGDKINRGRVKKMCAGGDFGPQFTERVPESVLAHKPLYLLFRVIDSRHLQMGVKADSKDKWILTPVWKCPYEIASLGDSCISTFTGIDGAPAYQQFLIDYWHCREGVSLEK